MAYQLTKDLLLADAPRDQLSGLRSEIENENAWIPVPNWLDPSADDLDMEEAINPVAAAVARQEGSAKAGRR